MKPSRRIVRIREARIIPPRAQQDRFVAPSLERIAPNTHTTNYLSSACVMQRILSSVEDIPRAFRRLCQEQPDTSLIGLTHLTECANTLGVSRKPEIAPLETEDVTTPGTRKKAGGPTMAGVTLTKQEAARLDQELAAAFTRGDMATVASMYTEDGVVMPPGSEAVRGRRAIEQLWRSLREQMGVQAVTISPQEVVASEDLAYEVGSADLHVATPQGEAIDTVKYLVAWKRQADGAWRLAADIFNTNAPA